jgi:hypothetical protein
MEDTMNQEQIAGVIADRKDYLHTLEERKERLNGKIVEVKFEISNLKLKLEPKEEHGSVQVN